MSSKGNKKKSAAGSGGVADRVPLDQFFFGDDSTWLWVVWGGPHHRKHKVAIPGSVTAARDYVRHRKNHEILSLRRNADAYGATKDIYDLMTEVSLRNNRSLEASNQGYAVPVIAFSGHGTDDGDWALTEWTYTLKDLLVSDLGRPLIIISDCCNAGNWCVSKDAERLGGGVTIIASVEPGECFYERSKSPGDEGNFWKLMLGRATGASGEIECEACKGLRTKKVTSYKDYTQHRCCHAATPFAFDSGELLRWDDLSCRFVHYGTHKCNNVGKLPRIPQWCPPSQDEHDAVDAGDDKRESSLTTDSSLHDNGHDADDCIEAENTGD